MTAMNIRSFSLLHYLEATLALAEYERDGQGVIVASVPDAPGFFSQGNSFEEARANLCETASRAVYFWRCNSV